MAANDVRVGVFGWGIVAPKSPTIEAFRRNLDSSESWLEPFGGFGPDNFLVGTPAFELDDYRCWIEERFPANRFKQIKTKLGLPTQYATGAFVQALGQNPGLEAELQDLGGAAHVYVGTGLGDLPTIYDASIRLDRAQRRWNQFWAQPVRNPALREWQALGSSAPPEDAPEHPDSVGPEAREETEIAWRAYWAGQSSELTHYLEELRSVEGIDVKGDVDASKKSVIRQKRSGNARLQKRWGAPTPPWDDKALANIIWNIHNTPASNVSMVGRITGLTFAPVGACATFGVCLKLAMNAIRLGEAKAVVVGAADPPPHPLVVGGFYNARVIAADGEVSRPLTGLRGTHVSGGSAIWIVGDYEYMTARGFEPLGLEPIEVGVSADADHIITPSEDGPLAAVRAAMAASGTLPANLSTWDLHATATPGDHQEVHNLQQVIPQDVLVTARKGTFGHGMGAAGGWELTAQYLGIQEGQLLPTPLSREDLNEEISKLHPAFVFDEAVPAPLGVAGKLSMGVGGVNSCVLSRPWER
ncbi:MAG: beta-ketoacyl synthase N-terminal-like domain-containing protein [Acidobacteriota bacterium]|nr:beta-ketoacyl synthase N-terminal-like domain-containing protein [Acidobacteriota bacterium]